MKPSDRLFSGAHALREPKQEGIRRVETGGGRGIVRRFLIAFVLILAGCTASQWNDRLSTPQDRALAVKAIESLRSGNIDALKGQMDPELFSQTLANSEKIKKVFAPNGQPQLVTVSSNTISSAGNSETMKALNYEMGSGRQWTFFQIILRESGHAASIVGWHATPVDSRPTAAGDFSFGGKGAINYVWIVAMLAVTLTSLIALVLAIRSKGLRRRWLWIVGSIVGLGQFSLNWTTGAWGIRPIAFSIFGSAFMKASPFDPWILSFSLPIVAVVFLFLRSRLLASDDRETAAF